jgi:DNA-binding XRE family transcriptional regulator
MKKPKMNGTIKNRIPLNLKNYQFYYIRVHAAISRKEIAENVGYSQHTLMRIEYHAKVKYVPIHFVFSLIQKIEQTYGSDQWPNFIQWHNDNFPGKEFYPDYGVSIDDIKRPVVKPTVPENVVKSTSVTSSSGNVSSNL